MKGSLQIKNNKYYVVLNLRDTNNKRKQKWISTGLNAKGNKRKAEELLQKYIQDYSQCNFVYTPNTLFCDYIENWVESRTNIQTSTKKGYKDIITTHIKPYFQEKGIILSKIKTADIDNYYRYQYECGMSSNTLVKHHEVIHACLQDAYNNDYIIKNVADSAQRPKKRKTKTDFYELNEIKTLLETVKNTNMEMPILLATYYGLRRSEILGLTWDCVDFEKNTISIKQKVIRTSDEKGHTIALLEEVLKTDDSEAVYPLIPTIKEHLKAIKNQQEENKKLFGNQYVSNNFICTWENGKALSPDYVSDKYSKILKQNNMRHIRFHDLRHSCGSLLLEIGFNLKEVQEWLRHSNYNTTADIYVHCQHNNKDNIGNKLDNLLSNSDSKMLEIG